MNEELLKEFNKLLDVINWTNLQRLSQDDFDRLIVARNEANSFLAKLNLEKEKQCG